MKPNFFRLTASTALWVATTLAAHALSLQRADVPADPNWIVHLDCDALRPTTIGQYVLGELDKPETQAKLAAFQSVFNLDPRTQLHGLTLYSVSGAPEDGVLLVYADFDPEHLTGLAENANDHESTKHNAHVIHNWVGQEKKGRKAAGTRVYAAIQGHRVIFGQREASVADALDVLDGATPNLSSTKTYAQIGMPGNHSFLQAASHKLQLEDSGPHAAIVRLAKSLRLEIGEANKQTIATLTVQASGEDVAGQIAAVGQGLLAILKLQNEKPEATKLAEAIFLKQDGSDVIARLAMPAASAVELIKADAARKEKRRAERAAAKRAHAEQ
jgi:hypothetical protein